MINLDAKIIIVTGAASGIGKGISSILAEQGAVVVAVDQNLEGVQEVAASLEQSGSTVEARELDVTKDSSIEKMVDNVISKYGQIDGLINNAGVIGSKDWSSRQRPNNDDWDAVLSVNLKGLASVTEQVSIKMMDRKFGKIVNIASIAARQGSPDTPHYSASKAGVLSVTRTFALRLAPFNINVNAICPGLLWTPIWEAIAQNRENYGYDPSLKGFSGRELFDKTVESWIPMKREQTPEDVGKLAAFLISEDAMNITGQAINLDGGRYMN